MYMADPFNKLLDLALEILTIDFSRFTFDKNTEAELTQAEKDELTRMEEIMINTSRRIDEITHQINFGVGLDQNPPNAAVILRMCLLVSLEWGKRDRYPGYLEYSNAIYRRRRDLGTPIDPFRGDPRIFSSMQMKIYSCEYQYSRMRNLDFPILTDEQRRLLEIRMNEVVYEKNRRRKIAFLEGARQAGLEPIPPEWNPPGFDGIKYSKQSGLGDYVDDHITGFFEKGGKIKGKSKKRRSKTTKRKTTLHKRRKTRRKAKHQVFKTS